MIWLKTQKIYLVSYKNSATTTDVNKRIFKENIADILNERLGHFKVLFLNGMTKYPQNNLINPQYHVCLLSNKTLQKNFQTISNLLLFSLRATFLNGLNLVKQTHLYYFKMMGIKTNNIFVNTFHNCNKKMNCPNAEFLPLIKTCVS